MEKKNSEMTLTEFKVKLWEQSRAAFKQRCYDRKKRETE